MPADNAHKAYSVRLAFDPETGFHLAENGKPVVTEDGGKTWRYAVEGEPSHIERYQERVVAVDSTANQFAELAFKHGAERAAELVDPHHFEAQPDDEHYDEGADGKSSPQSDPDHLAATITSHTDSWKDGS